MSMPSVDTSLKGLISVLAKHVDMTPAALYERQRALVRAGLLQAKPGRGPGSGVRATPESVSMLLISILATGNLSETEERSKLIADLKSETKLCPLTGKKTFATALATVLASEELSKRLRWIDVERSGSAVGASLVFERPSQEILTDQDYAEMKGKSRKDRAEVLKKKGRSIEDTFLNTISSHFGHKRPRFISMLDVRATLHVPFEKLAGGLKEVKEHERQHHPTWKK
jgi:DNA-binding IscR family transcriptional regulator